MQTFSILPKELKIIRKISRDDCTKIPNLYQWTGHTSATNFFSNDTFLNRRAGKALKVTRFRFDKIHFDIRYQQDMVASFTVYLFVS